MQQYCLPARSRSMSHIHNRDLSPSNLVLIVPGTARPPHHYNAELDGTHHPSTHADLSMSPANKGRVGNASYPRTRTQNRAHRPRMPLTQDGIHSRQSSQRRRSRPNLQIAGPAATRARTNVHCGVATVQAWANTAIVVSHLQNK